MASLQTSDWRVPAHRSEFPTRGPFQPSRSVRTRREGRRPRRRWIIAAVAVVGLELAPTPALAQWTVYDPANYAENVLHYVNQLTQIRAQVQQLQYQLQALSKLRISAWRNVQVPLRAMGTLMGGSRVLGYAAPGVGAAFQNTFPVSQPVTDWPAEERAGSQAAVDVFGAAVLATARQHGVVAPGAVLLDRMKALNGQVQGHEQALELQNTAAVYSAEELMLLRQAAMAQTNIQAVYYAHEVNAQAQRDATVRATLAQLATPPVGTPAVSLRVTP